MIEREAFQDEKDFCLQIPINSKNDCVYFEGQKKDVPDQGLIQAVFNIGIPNLGTLS